MPHQPNKLSKFWQELKRRNVVRVITVYAGAAFVILELVSIIIEPLRLPEWTLQFAIVFLCIGFIIAVILSWIYDIHPKEGVVKTKPAHEVKAEDVSKFSNNWKIASYISFVVIVGLIILNVIPRTGSRETLDKSIAVLPFRNDSPDEEKMYFINGTMEAILNNLCKIEDLRVPGRTSVEQYRDNPKPIPVVAEEMDVSYVLEGSGQKVGNRLLLTVQLIVGKDDRHIWSRQYDREIDKVEDLIDIQKEIAQMVANEIEAIITPEEKELIEKVPTNSLTAYEFYQRGREEYLKSGIFHYDSIALNRARDYYYKALEYDSTFAKAYTGLALVYFSDFRKGTYFSETYLDSLLKLTDTALSYDSQLAEAYSIRGRYFWSMSQLDKALTEYNRALELNPNDWLAYAQRGNYYYWNDNPVQSLEDYHKAAQLNRGAGLSEILGAIARAYIEVLGFRQKGLLYYEQALELDGDSARYYYALGNSASAIGNYAEAIELLKRGIEIDTNDLGILGSLGYCYLFIGELEDSYKYFEKHVKKLENYEGHDFFVLNNWHWIGYVYLKNGHEKEAQYFFDKQLEYCNKAIEMGRPYGIHYVYYDLAVLYALQGNIAMALDNLKVFNQMKIMPQTQVTKIKNDPLFENIRDEPEFQQIVDDMEAKYQAEHERVRQWLEENEML